MSEDFMYWERQRLEHEADLMDPPPHYRGNEPTASQIDYERGNEELPCNKTCNAGSWCEGCMYDDARREELERGVCPVCGGPLSTGDGCETPDLYCAACSLAYEPEDAISYRDCDLGI